MTSSSPPHVSAPQSHAEGNPLSYHHSCTWICTYVHLYTYATLDPFVRRATTAVSRSCSWPSYPGIPHRPRRPQPLDRIPDKGGLYRRMATAGAGGWAGSGEERGGITRRGEREGASLEWFPTRPKTRVSVRGVGDGRNLMYTYVWRSSRNATRCGKCQWATTLCAKRGVGHAAAALRRAGYWPRGELVQLHGRRRTRDATPAGLGMAGRCQQPARLDGVPPPPLHCTACKLEPRLPDLPHLSCRRQSAVPGQPMRGARTGDIDHPPLPPSPPSPPPPLAMPSSGLQLPSAPPPSLRGAVVRSHG